VSPERPRDITVSEPQGEVGVEARFRSMYERTYRSVYSYVYRRLGPSSIDAQDVTAQVFTVAWQRRDRVPPFPEDLPWLYGVARKMISRSRRSTQRRLRLKDRLTSEAKVSPHDEASSDPETRRVRSAISRLRSQDQEVVRLVLWEQLSHFQAGRVLGCSENAVSIRLHKARQRLKVELEKDMAGRNQSDSARAAKEQEGRSDGP
jgi:RNA polymerase sigma-70 factor (ECF subfamily)